MAGQHDLDSARLNRGPFTQRESIYLLYGRADDRFCLGDLRVAGLRDCLLDILMAAGYERAAFHHPIEGVSVLDFGSGNDTGSDPGDAAPAPRPPRRKKALVAGPLGKLRISREADRDDRTERRVPETPVRRSAPSGGAIGRHAPSRVERLPDHELASRMRGFLGKGQPRSAFVFESLEYLLNGVDTRVLPELLQFIRDVSARGAGNAICVFVCHFHDARLLLAQDADRQHFLFSLRDWLFDAQNQPRPNVFRIGAPDVDEVRNICRARRLRGEPAPSVRTLDAVAENIASDLKSEKDLLAAGLDNVIQRLDRIETVDVSPAQPALEELADMPGLEEMAEGFGQIVSFAREKIRDRQPGTIGVSWVPSRLSDRRATVLHSGVALNFAFLGNPGTGKTVVARLLGRALKENGILPSGHFIEAKASDMVSQYTGETALKTAELFERAMGGTLFIDEVQALVAGPNGAGPPQNSDAVRAMLKYLEDRKGELAVIVATYPNQFERFLEMDDGLPRRFGRRVEFHDYDGETCAEIFRRLAARQGLSITGSLDVLLPRFFDIWRLDRQPLRTFSNAGSVVATLGEISEVRFRNGTDAPVSENDFPDELRPYIERAARQRTGEDAIAAALEELEALTGLGEVKAAVRRIVNKIRINKLTGDAAPVVPGHMRFVGNPGTGKTTVARLMGNIFRELGVLESGHVHEVARGDLVGQYMGQTVQKTKKAVDEALGGILFIDEAHNLVHGERDQFGREAVGALTPRLSDDRDRLCVILAGYPAPIARLMSYDPGWPSRFPTVIDFCDYNEDEMAEIFRLICKRDDQGYTLSDELDSALPGIMAKLKAAEGERFSNGRSAGSLLGEVSAAHDDRVLADLDKERLKHLVLADVPEKLQP